ncbi:MAG: Hemolysin D [Gammaproteobacteria bacterium]|nr:Hemolysin D [Gammaproteobacteria bacterium]
MNAQTRQDNNESQADGLVPEVYDNGTTGGESAIIKPGRRWLRSLLLILGPLLFITTGGYFYVTGGRHIETDNAYIKANKVSLSAQVSGAITVVLVAENEHVVQGQELFRIDAAPWQVALTRAQARLQGVRAFIESLKAGYYQKRAELKRDELDLDYNEREYNRQLELSRSKLSSPADLDKTKHEMEMARQQIAITRQALDQIAAQLGGDPDRSLEDHPIYKEVQGSVDDALLNIEWTTVTAPFTGVAQKKPEPGQYVRAGEPVMVIVANEAMWIEANFKETELTYVRPGQSVRIHVDTYPDQEWHGTVTSLSQASGAEFSLLPPQNATGNWVKVVQRIPVRIAIETWDGAPALRAGMSTTVSIDTSHHRVLPKFLNALLSWLGMTSRSDTIAAGSR